MVVLPALQHCGQPTEAKPAEELPMKLGMSLTRHIFTFSLQLDMSPMNLQVIQPSFSCEEEIVTFETFLLEDNR